MRVLVLQELRISSPWKFAGSQHVFVSMGFLVFFCIGIPLALHGDAVPCVNVGSAHSRSVEAISWRSLLCQAVFWPIESRAGFRDFREFWML